MKYTNSQINDIFNLLKSVNKDITTSETEIDNHIAKSLRQIGSILQHLETLDSEQRKPFQDPIQTLLDSLKALIDDTSIRLSKQNSRYKKLVEILSEGENNG
ncbi:hypothetical protein ABMY23_22475 [Vibrio vulnificus]|uniref:hypothetical protein n=1 Tax=Vibrio vulnificus TaxID=672 RepID=UPI003EDB3B43